MVASNYFVFKMKPIQDKDSASTGFHVELFCYSMDRLMTVDKCCNAFTAKKLGEDIFKNGINNFWLGTNNITGEVNLQFLKFTSKDSQQMEVRQPYLVQYNESFYDFLARSASRCGEMLYFEGGALHLGMKLDTSKASTDQSDKADSVDYEDCMEKVLAVQDRHYDYSKRTEDDDNRYVDSMRELVGKYVEKNPPEVVGTKESGKVTETTKIVYENGVLTVEVVTNYWTSSKDKTENQLKGQPKEKTTTATVTNKEGIQLWSMSEKVKYEYKKNDFIGNYKKLWIGKFDVSTTTETTTSGQTIAGVYNQPEPNDAAFVEVKKDGYTSFMDEWFDWRTALVNNVFINLFDSTSLYDFFADLAASAAKSAALAGVTMKAKNDKCNEANGLTMTKTQMPEQTDGENFSLFSTLKSIIDENNLIINTKGDSAKVSLLAANFYSRMRAAATRVSKVLVRLNYGDNDQGLCLGDLIKVDGDYYVVIKVERDKKSNYIVEAIPPFYTDTTTVANSIPCPPLMPEIPTVRTSEPQVAFVEKNLDPDRLGRVRIRYPWQRNDGDCSPWVRMATPFATNGGGVTFRPCNGDEVLLNYEDGNIERPYVVGSLQSRYATDNWGALADRVIQSKNGHAITFADKDDGKDFFSGMIPALKMLRSVIPATHQLWHYDSQRKADLTGLSGGINIGDRFGLYSINMSSDGRVVNIESPLGNVNLNAFTGINISAPNGNINIKGKNVTIGASNKLTLESGSAVTDRFLPKDVFMNLRPKKLGEAGNAALNSLVEVGTDAMDRIVGKAIDLSFIRTLFEVFTRPVDGTLKIRSNTYLLMEAGEGSAQIPYGDYNHTKRKERWKGNTTVLQELLQEPIFSKLEKAIDLLTTKANTICDGIKNAYETAKTAKDTYESLPNYNDLTKMQVDNVIDKVKAISNANFKIEDEIKETDFDFDNAQHFEFLIGNEQYKAPTKNSGESQEDYDKRENAEKQKYDVRKNNDTIIIKPRREAAIKAARDLGSKAKALFDEVAKWKNFDLTTQERNEVYFSDGLRDIIRNFDIYNKFIDDLSKGTIDWSKDITKFGEEMTKLRRAMVYELITEAKDKDGYKDFYTVDIKATKPDFGKEDDWMAFVEYIKVPDIPSYKQGPIKYFTNYFRTRFLNDWLDATENPVNNVHKWKAPEKGRILISDVEGRTLRFDADQLAAGPNIGDATTATIVGLRRKLATVK